MAHTRFTGAEDAGPEPLTEDDFAIIRAYFAGLDPACLPEVNDTRAIPSWTPQFRAAPSRSIRQRPQRQRGRQPRRTAPRRLGVRRHRRAARRLQKTGTDDGPSSEPPPLKTCLAVSCCGLAGGYAVGALAAMVAR